MRLGLIGVGRWGKNIARTLQEFPEVELVTEDVSAAELEGVLIATPGSTHASVAEPYIKKGLAVFVEKPFTTSLAEAERLEQLANESGAVVQVGHIHLFNPAYRVAKSLVPAVGKTRFILCEGMNNGPVRDDLSAMWDWAPHDVAVLLDLMGGRPQQVQAWGFDWLRPGQNLFDAAVIHYRFPAGTEAVSVVSWMMPEKRKRITMVGEQDKIVFDDTAEKKVTYWAGSRPGSVVSYPNYLAAAPLKMELTAFMEAVKTRQVPLAGLSHAVDSVRVLAAAEKSIKLDGAAVTL